MVHLDVDAPASSWCLIIGKGGATLQKLKADFNVSIDIPRPNQPGSVKVRGREADCEACAEEIRRIVTSKSRGKDRGPTRAKASRGTKANGRASLAFAPPTCGLCATAATLTSSCTIFDHLGGSAHLCKVVQARPDLQRVVARRKGQSLGVLAVASALGDADFRAFHEGYGYNVEGLLDCAEEEHERRVKAAQMQTAIDRLDDAQWMTVEGRQVVGWDASCDAKTETLPLEKAPPLGDMVKRCHLGAKPPLVRVPANLPAALPQADPKNKLKDRLKAKHKYPAEVNGMRLALAASHCATGPRAAARRGHGAAASPPPRPLQPGDFDFVCGTSFIKALSGDSRAMRDEFFLQRVPLPPGEGARGCGGGGADRRRGVRGTVCVLQIPAALHHQDDTGHATERLLCGTAGPPGCCCALTAMRIPGIGSDAGESTRLLVCSEVDATAEDGSLVEIKSSKVHHGKALISTKVALQCAVNGSQFALSCSLDKDGANLESVQWLPFSGIEEGHEEALRKLGKHVRFCLDRVLAQLDAAEGDAEEEGAPPIFRMTFDDIKAPVLERAAPGRGVEVVPAELL